MFSKNLLAASGEYLRFKHRHDQLHHQAPRRPSIHEPGSGHHQAMIDLQEHLGQPGTPSHEIERFMGPPNKILGEPDETLLNELSRNNQKYEYPENAKIWIYEWRGNHDYVYFIISKDNKVTQSAWYYAFE